MGQHYLFQFHECFSYDAMQICFAFDLASSNISYISAPVLLSILLILFFRVRVLYFPFSLVSLYAHRWWDKSKI